MVQYSRDDRYFYISGLISLALFTAVLLLFALVILHKSEIKTFAMQKIKNNPDKKLEIMS